MQNLKNILFITFYLYCSLVTAQYKGKVVDQKTTKPIEFVNIGIIGKGIGTVTDENGMFALNIDDSYNNDSIRISCIGYQHNTFKVADFKKINHPIFFMVPKAFELKEIKIKSKPLKTEKRGAIITNKNMIAGFNSNDLGSELGVLINIKEAPTFLEQFHFSIAKNKYDSLFFRLNVYSVKDNLPDKNILKKNIYVSTNIKKGIVTVDLKPYSIVLNDDFFISLEWIKNLAELNDLENSLMFSASILNNKCYYRKTSQDSWKKVPVSIGFYTTVKY